MNALRAVWDDSAVRDIQRQYQFDTTADLLFDDSVTLVRIAGDLSLEYGWEEAARFAYETSRPRALTPTAPSAAIVAIALSTIPYGEPVQEGGSRVAVMHNENFLGVGRAASWSLYDEKEQHATSRFDATHEGEPCYVFTTGDHPDMISTGSDGYIVVSKEYADFIEAVLDTPLRSPQTRFSPEMLAVTPNGINAVGMVARIKLHSDGVVSDCLEIKN